jgi:hypothetical protein
MESYKTSILIINSINNTNFKNYTGSIEKQNLISNEAKNYNRLDIFY